MEIKKYIETIATAYLEEHPELFLVDVVVSGSHKKNKVLILVDGDQGVSIEQCAWLSRKVAAELEEKELMDDAYRLEVSSPGVEFPLKFERQYAKHVGRKVKLSLEDGSEKTGKLLEVGSGQLKLEEEIKEGKKSLGKEVEINFNDIKEMKVLVSFK